MPYIDQEIRASFDDLIESLLDKLNYHGKSKADGNLNYIISRLVADGINYRSEKWSYVDIARAIAVFECAKLEFYRRIAIRKEELAIRDNGDISSYEVHTNDR